MKKFLGLVVVLFVLGAECVESMNTESSLRVKDDLSSLVQKTQSSYNKFVANKGASIKERVDVVNSIVDTIKQLREFNKKTTSEDYCSYNDREGFESNCDLFLSELWQLLYGEFSEKGSTISEELLNKVMELDPKSLRLIGVRVR